MIGQKPENKNTENQEDIVAETLNNANNTENACENGKQLSQEQQAVAQKKKILNICTLIFTIIAVVFATVMYFISAFTVDFVSAYYIAATFILAMLLAAPTLKVFLDKCTCKNLRKFNIVTLVIVFAAILVHMCMVSLSFAFPTIFAQP